MRLERSFRLARAVSIAALLLFGTTLTARAQYLDFERTSLPFLGSPNQVVISDFDGDGFADLAVPEGSYGTQPPRLRVYWGPGPGPAVTLISYPPGLVPTTWNAIGGYAILTTLDFDGDGLQDLVFGSPRASLVGTNSGAVQIFLGPSLSPGPLLLPPSPMGNELFGGLVTPDLNGDGLLDLAIAAPGTTVSRFSNAGVFYTYIAPNWTAGPTIQSPFPSTNGFFPARPAFGDFNGDGFADLAVADNLLWMVLIEGPAFTTAYPSAIQNIEPIAAGDWVQDGFDDLVVGEVVSFWPNFMSGFRLLAGPSLLPTVFFSGMIYGLTGPLSASGPVDLNGDGMPDVLFGVNTAAMVYPGATAVLPLYSPYAPVPLAPWLWSPHVFGGGGPFGTFADVGDFDADGFEDFASSRTVGTSPPWSGSAEVFKAKTLQASAATVSLGAGGTVELRIRASAGHAGRTYMIVASASGTYPGVAIGKIRVPILPDAFTLVVAAGVNGPLFQNFVGTPDANGETTASLVVPPGVFPDPLLYGTEIHFADVIFNASSTGVQVCSNPATITLAP